MATKIITKGLQDCTPIKTQRDNPRYGENRFAGPSSLTPGQTASSKLQASPRVSADMVARRDTGMKQRDIIPSASAQTTFGMRPANSGGAPSGKVPAKPAFKGGAPVRKPSSK